MKKLLVMAALGAAGYGVYHWQASAPSTHKDLVENRIWIDHMPRGERDTIQAFVTIGDESVGAFQSASVWRGAYELFRYEGHGGELRVVYPQTGERETLRARATSCGKDGWDYCLELDGGSRGVKRYYSMRDWEIGSMRDVDARLRALGTQSRDRSSARK